MLAIAKYLLKTSFALSAIGFSCFAYADLPFNIVPNGSLPTTVTVGVPVEASYVVTNNTRYARSDNYVMYLPPNVTLDPDVGAGDCDTTFDLAAKGESGDSCILNLMVSGAVNAQDPDPKHHLFVCMSDRTTCAGTLYPLNVTSTVAPFVEARVLVGSYSTSYITGETSPPILQSVNDGAWALVPPDESSINIGGVNLGLPGPSLSNVSSPILSGISCDGSDCIGVGGIRTLSNGPIPKFQSFIQISSDGGANWAAVDSANIHLSLSEENQNSLLNGVVCESNVCTAVGSVSSITVDKEEFSFPLILTRNETDIWTSIPQTDIHLPSVIEPDGQAALNAISCSGTDCSVVGYYIISADDATKGPLILNGTLGGTSWIGVQADKIILPPQTDPSGSSVLNGIMCDGDPCVAVGSSTLQSSGQSFPLILIRDGDDWSSVAQESPAIQMPSDYDPTREAVLHGIFCEGSDCTAVGYYVTDDAENPMIMPLILNTSNNGDTWIATEDFTLGGFENVSLFSIDCGTDFCKAVGHNINQDSVILNNTQGVGIADTWTAVDTSTITLPEGFSLSLSSIDCILSTCTAVGSWDIESDYIPTRPLILNYVPSSEISWAAVPLEDIAATFDKTSYTLSTVQCVEEHCTSVGTAGSSSTEAFILNSEDAGESWAETTNIALPSDSLGMASLSGLSCINETDCIATGTYMGSYYDDDGMLPLILIGDNNTNSWTGVEQDQIELPSLLSDPVNVKLLSLKCQENNCVAVGSYRAPTSSSLVYAPALPSDKPFILFSTTSGASWELAETIVLPNDAVGSGSLYGVSCEGDLCTAVGSYRGTYYADNEIMDTISEILILNSTDGGANWLPVQQSSIKMPTNFFPTRLEAGSLHSVSCDKRCILLGSYPRDSRNIEFPLILKPVHENNPFSWSASISMEGNPGVMNGLTCRGEDCLSVGSWGANTLQRDLYAPVIMRSINWGETWSTTIPSNIELPEFTFSAALSGVNGGGASEPRQTFAVPREAK